MTSRQVHLGCGKHRIDGWDNVDPYSGSTGVIREDALKYMKKRHGGSIDVIRTIHMIEHIPRRNAEVLFKLFGTKLAPGGRLIIECPNVAMRMADFLNGTGTGNPIWGLQRYPGDFHYWGYTPESLRAACEKNGLEVTFVGYGRDRHSREGRTPEKHIRLEAVKP